MQFLQIQFVVDKTEKADEKTVNEVFKSLSDLKGIRSVSILNRNTVIVDSNVPSSIIQEKIESIGCAAILKGYGG
jgi:hypothetical protein